MHNVFKYKWSIPNIEFNTSGAQNTDVSWYATYVGTLLCGKYVSVVVNLQRLSFVNSSGELFLGLVCCLTNQINKYRTKSLKITYSDDVV